MILVRFSDQADTALLDILTYIAEDDPVAAIGLIEDLQQRVVSTLGQFPEAGAKWNEGLRVLTIRRYTFIYRHDAARSEVVVLDVFFTGYGLAVRGGDVGCTHPTFALVEFSYPSFPSISLKSDFTTTSAKPII